MEIKDIMVRMSGSALNRMIVLTLVEVRVNQRLLAHIYAQLSSLNDEELNLHMKQAHDQEQARLVTQIDRWAADELLSNLPRPDQPEDSP